MILVVDNLDTKKITPKRFKRRVIQSYLDGMLIQKDIILIVSINPFTIAEEDYIRTTHINSRQSSTTTVTFSNDFRRWLFFLIVYLCMLCMLRMKQFIIILQTFTEYNFTECLCLQTFTECLCLQNVKWHEFSPQAKQ